MSVATSMMEEIEDEHQTRVVMPPAGRSRGPYGNESGLQLADIAKLKPNVPSSYPHYVPVIVDPQYLAELHARTDEQIFVAAWDGYARNAWIEQRHDPDTGVVEATGFELAIVDMCRDEDDGQLEVHFDNGRHRTCFLGQAHAGASVVAMTLPKAQEAIRIGLGLAIPGHEDTLGDIWARYPNKPRDLAYRETINAISSAGGTPTDPPKHVVTKVLERFGIKL